MRTAKPTIRDDQVRHLSENLRIRLAQGKEWATPGVEAALQRAVAGLDTGLESASPRIQAALRRIADELAVGVETLTPRVHEGLKRVAPKAVPVTPEPGPADTGRSSGKAWLIAGVLAAAVAGAVAWRSLHAPAEEPVAPGTVQTPDGAAPGADTAPLEAGM